VAATAPRTSLIVRDHQGQPFYEAFWRLAGKQVKRRIGPAWLELAAGGWQPRRGRVQGGFYDERAAYVEAARLAAEYAAEASDRDRIERERRQRGATFREVAHAYLEWLERVKKAKPSTLADYRWLLAEPCAPHKRGNGTAPGYVMAAFGGKPAANVTSRDVEAMFATIRDGNASARSVNKARALVSAIYNYAAKDTTFGLAVNPAAATDKRREPHPAVLVFYSPEEVELLARTLHEGGHRDRGDGAPLERAEDAQDAELVRVAAYAGLRQGELLALRWRDVDFTGRAVTVSRAMSAGIESSTKSGRIRRVPLADQAAAALDRLSRRNDYTLSADLVFCNVLGRSLDGSALRRRFKRARDAAGLRPLRFHDLRHTYGSLLAAAGIDLVTIQAAMGHRALSTTSRYLHARPASEQAAAFTRAFEPGLGAGGPTPTHAPA
jgi:integrase